MKGPFGLLLIGGGIILIVGLFTGKIVFPGGAGVSIPGLGNITNSGLGGTPNASLPINNISGKNPNTSAPVGGNCPPGFQMMPTGVCMRIGAIK